MIPAVSQALGVTVSVISVSFLTLIFMDRIANILRRFR